MWVETIECEFLCVGFHRLWEQISWEERGAGKQYKRKKGEGEEDDIGWTSFTETRTVPMHLHMAHYLLYVDFFFIASPSLYISLRKLPHPVSLWTHAMNNGPLSPVYGRGRPSFLYRHSMPSPELCYSPLFISYFVQVRACFRLAFS